MVNYLSTHDHVFFTGERIKYILKTLEQTLEKKKKTLEKLYALWTLLLVKNMTIWEMWITYFTY